jgi:hypothetical protein
MIYLQPNGTFATEIYEKDHNPYLYLPSHSTHPSGSLKGLIYGSLHRIIRLTTSPESVERAVYRLYCHLLAQGYEHTLLKTIINNTYARLSTTQPHYTPANSTASITSAIILHLQYHPMDPPSTKIQQLFREEIHSPPGLPELPDLKNHQQQPIGINRLLIAYHRPPNIGNLLSPRVLKAEHGPLVSSYLDQISGGRHTHIHPTLHTEAHLLLGVCLLLLGPHPAPNTNSVCTPTHIVCIVLNMQYTFCTSLQNMFTLSITTHIIFPHNTEVFF